MPSQRLLDEWRGKYAPAFPVDGIQIAVEHRDDGKFVIHGWLMFESFPSYKLQPSAPIAAEELDEKVYRIEFPHRIVLDSRPGRTDVR